MKKITLVTTFHKEGYEKYGRRMLQSFVEHAPQNINLVAYAEDFQPDFVSDRVTYIDLHKACQNLVTFKKKFGRFTEAKGIVFQNNKAVYSYHFDAIRFSHKVYAVVHAAKHLDSDLMFWVDADVVAIKSIPEGFFEGLMAEDVYTCYLGREHMYTECGLVGYNLKHPENINFVQLMENIYNYGDLFLLEQWHDCMVYDAVRDHFFKQGKIKVNNLSAHLKKNMHPFINTELGEYMDHLKGPARKENGASFDSDFVSKNGQKIN
ncbi:hypothetical protein [Litoribrevibacter albus]|uniref:Uncharacterized protein n=1 Tax=Litoribrevibacter albus TaxID=1473156 RepID=A0AA37W898_9GAMM|nr:hypothetical protein [Litoribrevibacter albus]GLQ32233.1 hypothetical protein GCM10007876_27120 [Litoribrevibacter albus]